MTVFNYYEDAPDGDKEAQAEIQNLHCIIYDMEGKLKTLEIENAALKAHIAAATKFINETRGPKAFI